MFVCRSHVVKLPGKLNYGSSPARKCGRLCYGTGSFKLFFVIIMCQTSHGWVSNNDAHN